MSDNDQSGAGNGSENPVFGSPPPPPPPGGSQWGQPPAGGWGQQPPPAYGQPPPGYGQPPPAYGQMPAYGGMPANTGTNGFAIASLVCAFLCWPLGFVFGFIARNQIKQSNQGGSGLALAGLIISAVALVGTILYIILVAVVVHKCNNGDLTCTNNNFNDNFNNLVIYFAH